MDLTDNNSKNHLDQKRDDLQHVYEQANEDATMEKDQQEMISNVFEISENSVYEAMTPRTEISAVSKDDPLEKILHTFIDSGHSKLPVYETNIDNIIGIVYLYDLFNSPENISDFIKPVIFIPYTKILMDVIIEFQTSHHAIAIVLDEHGGTCGLITAEDMFEELFGDFEDEFDINITEGKKLNDGSIIANTRMNFQKFNKQYGNIIPIGDYETIGGFIISQIGRIPNEGEHLFTTIGQIQITKASARKIQQVKIFPNK